MAGIKLAIGTLRLYVQALEGYPNNEGRAFATALRAFIDRNADGPSPIQLGDSLEDRKIGHIVSLCQRALSSNQDFSDLYHSRPTQSEDDEIDAEIFGPAPAPVLGRSTVMDSIRRAPIQPTDLGAIDGDYRMIQIHRDLQQRGSPALAQLSFASFIAIADALRERHSLPSRRST